MDIIPLFRTALITLFGCPYIIRSVLNSVLSSNLLAYFALPSFVNCLYLSAQSICWPASRSVLSPFIITKSRNGLLRQGSL